MTPVLSFAEVETEPHVTERDTFYRDGDYLQPMPAPRFSRSVPPTPTPPGEPGRTPKPYYATGYRTKGLNERGNNQWRSKTP